MSNIKIYGIYDKDLGIVMVQREENDALAIRNFSDACNEKGTVLSKHPENYSLFKLCEVDATTGQVVNTDSKHMMKAEECVIKSEAKS